MKLREDAHKVLNDSDHRSPALVYKQRHLLLDIGPKLNPEEPAQVWFDRPGAPKPKLANENPKAETVDYDTLIKSWPATPPKRADAK